MIRAVFVAAVLAACTVAWSEEPLVIKEKGKDHFDTSFPSSGRLQLDVRSGDVRVSGTDKDKVSIHFEGRKSGEVDDVSILFKKTGSNGVMTLSGGPRNDFQILIEIPRETDLQVRMPFGALEIESVHGSKNVELHAGDVSIELGDPKEYSHIEASVTTGGLDSAPLGISKGGLFRSFKRDGPGRYRLYAHVGSGELDLR
jgi:hypothetical protein